MKETQKRELYEEMSKHYDLAKEAFDKKETDIAIEHCKAAIEAFESTIDLGSEWIFFTRQKALKLLGHIYFTLDRNDEALACVRKFYNLTTDELLKSIDLI